MRWETVSRKTQQTLRSLADGLLFRHPEPGVLEKRSNGKAVEFAFGQVHRSVFRNGLLLESQANRRDASNSASSVSLHVAKEVAKSSSTTVSLKHNHNLDLETVVRSCSKRGRVHGLKPKEVTVACLPA